MIMNLHPDEPNVVSTISISKSRDKQLAGLPEEPTTAPGQAIVSHAIDRDDSKLPFDIGMNNSGYSLSTILSTLLEQSSSSLLQSFPSRPIQVEHDLFSTPSNLQQQIATLNNSELLQLLLQQNLCSNSSRFHRDGSVDVLGLGVHNLSNPTSSAPPFLSRLHPATSISGKARESVMAGLRVLCPARGMPADHDFEVSNSTYDVAYTSVLKVVSGFHCCHSPSTPMLTPFGFLMQRAHFTITPDMKHGEELRCSHPVCQAGGVKFCYCAVCKKPAAKRNFRGRHHHIDEDPCVHIRKDFTERLQRDEATMSIASTPQESLIGSTYKEFAVASQRKEQFSGVQMKPDARSSQSTIITESDTPDFFVMSCKARGMPSDHNSKASMVVIYDAHHRIDSQL